MLKSFSEFFLNMHITTETIFMIHQSDLCSLLKVLVYGLTTHRLGVRLVL